MTAIRVERFGGMTPILSNRLLPDSAATLAINTNMESGEIRPVQVPKLVTQFGSTVKRALRIPDPDAPGTPVWLVGASQFARFFPAPLVNDTFSRFVWIDANAPGSPVYPVVNSFARIKTASPAVQLGVPRPPVTPSLVVVGGSGVVLTRSYVYTLVNIFNEEGQPSDPVTVSGFANGSWNLSALTNVSGRNIVSMNVYRTITGSNGATLFYRVATFAVASTYNDTIPDSTVLLSPVVLESASWADAPVMEGLALMPGGFFVGWNGKNIYFSVPFRPWAWPVDYQLAVPNKVLGCAAFGDSIVVLTEGRPAIISGTRPENVSLMVLDYAEPCVTPNSILSTPEGVYFVGRSGLMMITPSGAENITRSIISQADWRDNYVPANLSVARVNSSQLLAFSTVGTGFIMDLSSERNALQRIINFDPVDSVFSDIYTGTVFLLSANGVWEWSQTAAPYAVCRFESKDFHLPEPVNFGALKVYYDTSYDPFTVVGETIVQTPSQPVAGGPWTDRTSLYNYTTYNGGFFNEAPAPGVLPPGGAPPARGWPYWYGAEPLNFSSSVSLELPIGVPVYFELYADGELVWSNNVLSNTMYKLRSGFKGTIWRFVVISRVPVYSVHIAETGKELAEV